MSKQIVLLLTLPMLGIVLTACPKKPDAAVEAGAVDAAVVVLTNPADDAAIAQFDAGSSASGTAGGTTATAKPATADAGSAATAATAATAEPVASAVPVAAGGCCCELPSQQLASLPQSDCAKVKHGKCVKKERCAEPSVRPVDGTKCCCDVNGVKSIIGQSECAKGGQGKCIKMHECKGR